MNNTKQIKKNVVNTLNSVLEQHAKVNDSLSSIIDEYITTITDNVSEEYYETFGIGVAGEHSQFGAHYGFINYRLSYTYSNEGNIYTVTGNGYNIAGDWNAGVKGSTYKDMLEFAKKLPAIIEEGINEIKQDNEIGEVLVNKLSTLLNK